MKPRSAGGQGDRGPIDACLAALACRLRGPERTTAEALAEWEAHLRESAAGLERSGLTSAEAERQAVERFGTVATVTRAHHRALARTYLAVAADGAARLGATGLCAIGASALGAWLLAALVGTTRVFAPDPGTRSSAASCAHYLAVQPGAGSCARAALWESRDDALFQRGAAGVLGLLALAALVWWRHHHPTGRAAEPLLVSWAGLTIFAVTGSALLGYAIDRSAVGTGAGQWYVSALVALTVAAGCAQAARRVGELRPRRAQSA